MDSDKPLGRKIGLLSLIMMIFSTVFGFANSTVAYEQMGYAAIIWYVFAALFFFLPVALMIAEYGSALKSAQGGIYSWLEVALGEKQAFIGTFIWLCSWIIWMVSTASKIWIPFSALLFGSDQTQTWTWWGLNSTEVVGLLGIVWVLLVTYLSSRGIEGIAKVGTFGGFLVSALTVIFLLVSLVIFVANHGVLQEPIHGASTWLISPNQSFKTPVAILSFVVYAVFAYSGLEAMGGVMDSLEKPQKTFPRGLIIAMLLITVLYSLSILMWGISTNWHRVLSDETVNLGNITYIMMNNAGLVLGHSLGLSHQASVLLGSFLTRFAGLGMFAAYVGSFFIMLYSPIKSFILGSDQRLWPAKLVKVNAHGMPANAMWWQAAIVSFLIFAVAFGGSAAQKFYLILTDMSNVASTAPYLFIIGAFPAFKRRTDLERPYVFFKKPWQTQLVTWLVQGVVLFGIVFTCLQPILDHDYTTAFWTIIGPLFFGALGWLLYHHQTRKPAPKQTKLGAKVVE